MFLFTNSKETGKEIKRSVPLSFLFFLPWVPRICISTKFPRDADVAGLGVETSSIFSGIKNNKIGLPWWRSG